MNCLLLGKREDPNHWPDIAQMLDGDAKGSAIIAIDYRAGRTDSWLVAPWLSAVVISEPLTLLYLIQPQPTCLHHHLYVPGPVPDGQRGYKYKNK